MGQFSFSSLFAIISENYTFLLEGMGVSLQITAIAIVVGILWGIILAILRLYGPKPIAWLATGYVNLFRSIPLIMVLMWFYLAIGPTLQQYLGLGNSTGVRLFWAIVAFSLFEAAYYSEIIRAGFKSVRRQQMSAALALGMTRGQAIYYVILPQALRNMIPLLLTQGIILFQDTSLVYIMSLNDFFRTTDIIGYNNNAKMEMILFAGFTYFVICFSLSYLVRTLQKRRGSL
ncbi:ABC transporter permease subunit [Ignatzschineria cameli]|uniref:Glutamate/aspartate import permease protein GltK n=1 Tax=Ignatzschineria cameli TaxID=2182793 RepID=A0A2U2APM5_9GAMM|nr:ABC transporter permease subunit [Ignatzschineria cameli]PWD83355.1 amino acid ABC transporter permease [Ignatzschineria cameli]PWD85473.1 amino acid ABC transporter permease [Ignatzschineria cameli]PWD89213.1 amino acid ABC transporter permease [Ignatzschineria cameli]PWD90613.1 amino acid ABC transporter permease [Ignatzschineria cameli]PWD91317.1 amino acid ABC transporter permease [Ignatzschineria cameli]